MKYLIHECTGTCGKVSHKILGSGEGGMRILQCDKCGSTSWKEEARRVKNPERHRWPYYNESAGQTFTSEDHEKHYVKENKLEAL